MTQTMELSTVEPTPLARAEPPTIEHLMMAAIERGADVETLERLVALQRQVAADKARDAYIEAVGNFRRTVPPIVKNKTGHVGRFADLSHISKIIDPILHANGLVYDWDTSEQGDEILVTCNILHRDGHTRSSKFAAPVDPGNKATSGPQRCAITVTYCKRQSLVNALGLVVDDDKDGRPTPGAAPDADKTAPRATSREARKTDGPVTDAEVIALKTQSGFKEKSEFVAWAQDLLQCGGLDKVANWDRQGLEYLWKALEEQEGGDAHE